jgi:hypothetical protein
MRDRVSRRLALVIALLATFAAIQLHWVSFTHSGGLWRDEIAVTNIATLPSVVAMWTALPHDHCPILFAAAIRAWVATFGGSDGALRTFGFAIGLFLLSSLWVAGWVMWRGAAVLSLTLFALNVVVIRYGDSIRAYELATACIVLTMTFVWRFVQRPDVVRGAAAAAMATASVQVLYQNSVLVLALCVAACVVFLLDREWRKGAAALAIGVFPALSLVPYIRPLLRAQDWWVVSKTGLSAQIVSSNLVLLTEHPARWFRFVWLALLVSAVLLALERAIVARAEPEVDRSHKLGLFAGASLVIGISGFGLFVATAQLPTQPWYFLLPLGFAAVCCDAILSGASFWIRVVVLGLALLTGALAYFPGVHALQFRQTDGDSVAAQLSRLAEPDDLILVNPWYYGLTFNRYYRGAAPWTTLPGLADYRYHRYDLLKLKLETPHPERPVLDRVVAALQAGHRVWVVGWIPVIRIGTGPPPELPPAPNGPDGWFDDPYTQSWGAQLYYLLATGAQTVAQVPVDCKERINPLENMGLAVYSGWQAQPPASGMAVARGTGDGGPSSRTANARTARGAPAPKM